MNQSTKNKTISYQVLADFFHQLAQMECAGISTINSISLMQKTELTLSKQLIKMQKFISVGDSLSAAAYKAGIFTSTHRAIISSAEKSGTLGKVYKYLALYYQQKNSRLKKIKSKLYLPLLMLFLALFIQPLPLLIKSEITVLSYLSQSLGQFALLLILFFLLLKLPLWFTSVYHRLQMQFPLVSNWVIKRQINTFFQFFGIMLDAGLAFDKALPLSIATIENTVLRKRFNIAIRNRHTGGDSVQTILSNVKDIPSPTLSIIHSGEESGRLAESVLHFANIEAETIYLQDDSLAEWLPRIFYFTVVLWMATSLLGF